MNTGNRQSAIGSRLLAAAIALACAACEYSVPPEEVIDPALDVQLRQAIGQWGVIPIGPVGPGDSNLVRLGQALFFDRELSGNRDISCGTCHDPATAMADGLSLGVGTGFAGSGLSRTPGSGRQYLPRSVPSLINEGLRSYHIFWDGRLSGFGSGPFVVDTQIPLPNGLTTIHAAQAMLPVLNRAEMRGRPGDLDVRGDTNELALVADDNPSAAWTAVMNRLMRIPQYVQMFQAAYGLQPSQLHFRHAATALAAFQTHMLTRSNTAFDRFLARDNGAMSDEAKRGGLLFFGRARCSQCHSGALLGGQSFANVGVPQLGPGTGTSAPLDLGRGALVNQEFYRFAFRIPPLRNVELTAPYFHDGVYPTLEAVVDHYDDVQESLSNFDVTQVAAPLRSMHHGSQAVILDQLQNLDFRVQGPLNLTETEKAQLVAFLKSLTDPAARDMTSVIPASVPSGLPVR